MEPKIIPEFKVGDIIIKKHNDDINKFGKFPITSIVANFYMYDKSPICSFEEQEDWELVKEKIINY